MKLNGKIFCLSFFAALLFASALSMAVKEVHAFRTVRGMLEEQGIWLQEKTSKAMLLARQETPPDIVFIGSSRIQFHIDTAIFKEAGISAFNYGLSGFYWEDYSYAVNRAVESGAKVIVISVAPDNLARPVPCPEGPTLEDWLTHISFRGLFNRCLLEGKEKFLSVFYGNRYKKFLDNTDQLETRGNFEYLRDIYHVQPNRDQVSYVYGTPYKLLVTFKNGDGIIYSSTPIERTIQNQTIGKPSEESMSYLKVLAKPAVEAGVKVVLLLQPMAFKFRYSGAENTDLHSVGVGLIDASNLVFDHTKWADENHFNAEGRALYTRQLLDVLKPLFRRG